MKKLLSFLAAGALALGLVGCSGDLHDADVTILATSGIIGTINGWSPAKMTKIDDNTYSYDFTASDSTGQFSIQEMSGSWTTRWAGYATKNDKEAVTIAPDDDFKTMVYTNDADPSHVQLSGLSKASIYTITIRIDNPDTKTISAKIELKQAVENESGPLDDILLKGELDSWGAGMPLVPNSDKTSYSVSFTASKSEVAFKLANEDWSVAYPCVGADDNSAQTVAGDGQSVRFYKGDSGLSNPSLTGLESGATYVMTVVPSDDETYVTVTVEKD